MTKTLVTGAAGFIGSHVVRELVSEGRDVRAMVMPGEDTRNLDGLDVELFQGDITDRDSVSRSMKGVDRVYHLAAIYAIWLPRREQMFEVNCLGSMNICWAGYRRDIERLIFTSSIAAIGYEDSGACATEETNYNHQGNGNDYILSKWISEAHALTFAGEGLPIVVCNPTGPIGAGDIGPTPTGQALIELLNGRLRFYFNTGINLVDVEDVARGHILAEKKGRIGERYLLGGENLKMKDLFGLVSHITGTRLRTLPLPIEAAIPVGDLLERYADLISHRPPPFTGDSVRYLRKPMYVEIDKARKELGYEPRPIEDAVRRAIKWFADNGYTK